VNYYQQAAGDA